MGIPDKLAVLDHSKKEGEAGQYGAFGPEHADAFETIIDDARIKGWEIRWYWINITTKGNRERVPFKIIRTEIPPNTIQKLHHHETVHEVSVIEDGELWFYDHEGDEEFKFDNIIQNGYAVRAGEMVIEEPGIPHTVANFSGKRATFITYQVIRTDEEFVEDRK